MSNMVRALRLDQTYRVFRNEPLAVEELDAFYRDASKARGEKTRERLARQLRENLDINEHILLVGYKGCGKSTELNYLERDLSDEFLVLNISIQKELDPVHVQYIELFIVTMERLFKKVEEFNIRLRPELLESIQKWTASTEINEIREKYLGDEVEIGGGVDLKYLLQFFAKFRLAAKNSQTLKETLKRNVEPRLSDLIGHCNALLSEIRLRLPDVQRKDILLILEDLDKIPIDRAQDMFYNYTNQLVQLNTNVVYTFHSALYYNVKFNQIKSYFSRIYELPMIMVTQSDGKAHPEGMKVMRQIVDARMDTEKLFEQADILDDMISLSGGVLRDLFLLIIEAAEYARDNDRNSINRSDFEGAVNKLKRDYDNNIADKTDDGKVVVKAEEYYQALVNLANDQDKKVENTEIILDLRQNLAVLGYNGKGWCDVHPVVKEILKDRKKL